MKIVREKIYKKHNYSSGAAPSATRPPQQQQQFRRVAFFVWSARGLPAVGNGSRKRVMRTLSSKRLVVSRHSPERRKEVMAAPDLVCVHTCR